MSWKDNGHLGAKKVLDEVDDLPLLGVEQLTDASMAAAVRAMLFLWSGWPGDCVMCSQTAPVPERTYLAALCERHQGHFAEAKGLFKLLEDHPVYQPLAESALATIGLTGEPTLQRLREMLRMDTRWEPYLFCDAVANALAGKARGQAEALLRKIQCLEFELLFKFCYERATGQKISYRNRVDSNDAQKRAAERERRIREEKRRREEKRKREEAMAKKPEPSGPKAKPEVTRSPTTADGTPLVSISCPKCGHAQQVPAASRGKPARCKSCNAPFLVPAEGGSASASKSPPASNPAVVTVICPKCGRRAKVAAANRGKPTQCGACKATFMVPKAAAAASR